MCGLELSTRLKPQSFTPSNSMATRGASGLMLQPHWRMMGALEAADGMLLFGISTAFIFTVMQFYYQHLVFLGRPGGGAVKGG